ncbi:hypothetical protein ACLB2K_052936 [Fragaria x ananassa]
MRRRLKQCRFQLARLRRIILVSLKAATYGKKWRRLGGYCNCTRTSQKPLGSTRKAWISPSKSALSAGPSFIPARSGSPSCNPPSNSLLLFSLKLALNAHHLFDEMSVRAIFGLLFAISTIWGLVMSYIVADDANQGLNSDHVMQKGYSSLVSFTVPDINQSVTKLMVLGAELDGPIKYEIHGKVAALRCIDGHMVGLYEPA